MSNVRGSLFKLFGNLLFTDMGLSQAFLRTWVQSGYRQVMILEKAF